MSTVLTPATALSLAQDLRDNPVINYAIAVFIVAALIYLAVLQYWVLLRTRKHLREIGRLPMTRSIFRGRSCGAPQEQDITDSLTYARRIQTALLPAEHHIKKSFRTTSFITARSISSAETFTGSVKEAENTSSQPLTVPDMVCPAPSCQ